MPSAPGTLIHQSSSKLTGIFVIDEIQYTFAVTINPAIQPFTVNEATLTYDSPDALTANQSVSGQISDKIKLTLRNGVVIEARPNPPGLQPSVIVNGTGVWQQN